ncbi:MAG: universal stress protein [Bacteroidales bacterium]|nr:universal stress protein [Bacteroidales bacterium]
MKKVILTGIDFSDCSINALEHAISIANKADADVCMVWVNRPVSGKEIYLVSQDQIVAEAITRFEGLIAKYQNQMGRGKIYFKVRKGKIYREIVELADELDAFLVVIGTHGASGFEEFWMGSNAFRIVSAIQRPIISIRGGVDINRTIQKVVMPIDSTVESRQKTPMTALIAKYFDAEIHVLALLSSDVPEIVDTVREYIKQVEVYLKENEVRYIVKELKTNNLTTDTIQYALEVQANLISIMDEQEIKPSNIWLGPFAQQMVHRSPIPVMSIHAKDFTMAASM